MAFAANIYAMDQKEFQTAMKECESFKKENGRAYVAKLDEVLLSRTDLTRDQKLKVLENKAATLVHTIQDRDLGKPVVMEIISMLRENLTKQEGEQRIGTLGAISRYYSWYWMTKEKNDCAREILEIRKNLLATDKYRNDFNATLDLRRDISLSLADLKETEARKEWDAETTSVIEKFLKEKSGLPDDEWLAKVPYSRIIAGLAVNSEGKEKALAVIEKILAMGGESKAVLRAKSQAPHFGNFLREGDSDLALRYWECMRACAEAAEISRDWGQWAWAKMGESDALYRYNHDLDRTRFNLAQIASFPKAPKGKRDEAALYLEMISDLEKPVDTSDAKPLQLSEKAPYFDSKITDGGKAAAQIRYSLRKPNRQIEYAATELTNWVAKISGAELPVNVANSTLPLAIVLGTPQTSDEIARFAATYPEDFSKLEGNDGFIIRERDNVIYIAARITKGVLNGVYRFLEKNTDIIFVRPLETNGRGTVYGDIPTIKNCVKDLVDIPDIPLYRHWTSHGYYMHQFSSRLLNHINPRSYDGNMNPAIFKQWMTLDSMDNPTATLWLGIVMKYAESDPDIFPIIDGKRQIWHDCQLCFMNPKTADLFAKEAVKMLRGLPDRVTEIAIGLGDNSSVCNCEEWCMKPIKLADGSELPVDAINFRSTQYAVFCNRVWELIHKELPYINPPAHGAYLFTAEAPAIRPIGGAGTYCPYIKNHKKPVYDDDANEVWHRKAEDFKKAGMPFQFLYEYYLCSTTPQYFHAICEVAQKDIAYYQPALLGYYNDAGYSDTADNGMIWDASAIEFWTMSRLMWKNDIDLVETRREFCRRAYREAADIMIPYYEKLAAVYNEDPAGCFWNDDPVLAIKHYVVEKDLADWMRGTLEKALAAVRHPSSKWLIERHANWMLEILEKAEKTPKKTEITVPLLKGEPDTDIDGNYWKAAAEIAPLTEISNPRKPPRSGVRMKTAQDGVNLFLLIETHDAGARKAYDKYAAEGKVGKSQDDTTPFDWCTLFELYLDGGRRTAGSYYQFGLMMNERRTTNFGSAPASEPVEWTAKIVPVGEDGLRALIKWPFDQIKVEPSKYNKIGAMFLVSGTAWNGGQWHAPTAFQTLKLELK